MIAKKREDYHPEASQTPTAISPAVETEKQRGFAINVTQLNYYFRTQILR